MSAVIIFKQEIESFAHCSDNIWLKMAKNLVSNLFLVFLFFFPKLSAYPNEN